MVVRTHPVVIIGGLFWENPFFVPPDQLLLEIQERREPNGEPLPHADLIVRRRSRCLGRRQELVRMTSCWVARVIAT